MFGSTDDDGAIFTNKETRDGWSHLIEETASRSLDYSCTALRRGVLTVGGRSLLLHQDLGLLDHFIELLLSVCVCYLQLGLQVSLDVLNLGSLLLLLALLHLVHLFQVILGFLKLLRDLFLAQFVTGIFLLKESVLQLFLFLLSDLECLVDLGGNSPGLLHLGVDGLASELLRLLKLGVERLFVLLLSLPLLENLCLSILVELGK